MVPAISSAYLWNIPESSTVRHIYPVAKTADINRTVELRFLEAKVQNSLCVVCSAWHQPVIEHVLLSRLDVIDRIRPRCAAIYSCSWLQKTISCRNRLTYSKTAVRKLSSSVATPSQLFLRATAYAVSAHICYRNSVRLSVCLSDTRVDQSKTVEGRIMHFSPQSSPIPLVFAR